MPPTKQHDEQAQKERYLRAIGQVGTLTAGCKAAKASPHTVYKWREHDETFALQEQQARNAFADLLEEEAVRRAHKGVKKPVYQGGELVGHIDEYSDTLLIFLLKAVRPDKYRERVDMRHSGGVNVGDGLSPDERERVRAALIGGTGGS